MPNLALALAQAAPSAAPTDLLGAIAQYGLLGVLFVLALVALRFRDKELTAERAARLADAQAMANMIKADTEAKVAANLSREATNRLLESLAKNQEAAIAKIDMVCALKERT